MRRSPSGLSTSGVSACTSPSACAAPPGRALHRDVLRCVCTRTVPAERAATASPDRRLNAGAACTAAQTDANENPKSPPNALLVASTELCEARRPPTAARPAASRAGRPPAGKPGPSGCVLRLSGRPGLWPGPGTRRARRCLRAAAAAGLLLARAPSAAWTLHTSGSECRVCWHPGTTRVHAAQEARRPQPATAPAARASTAGARPERCRARSAAAGAQGAYAGGGAPHAGLCGAAVARGGGGGHPELHGHRYLVAHQDPQDDPAPRRGARGCRAPPDPQKTGRMYLWLAAKRTAQHGGCTRCVRGRAAGEQDPGRAGPPRPGRHALRQQGAVRLAHRAAARPAAQGAAPARPCFAVSM